MINETKQSSECAAHLVWFELGVIQFLDCVLHVFIAHKLHDAGAVMKHICIADVASLTHVVLEVLPAAGRRETCHYQKHIPDEVEAPSVQTHKPVPDKTQESGLITALLEALLILLQYPEQSVIPETELQSVIQWNDSTSRMYVTTRNSGPAFQIYFNLVDMWYSPGTDVNLSTQP